MLLKKVTFISFLLLIVGMYSPAHAVVATKSTVKNVKEIPSKKLGKKMTFRDKIKLIKQVRAERKAFKRANPGKTQSIFQNRLFVLGLIFLAVGIVSSILPIGIVRWLGGLLGLVGFIMMIIALIQEFT